MIRGCQWICFHHGSVTIHKGLGISETMPEWMFWASVALGIAVVVGAGTYLLAGAVRRR